MIQCSRCGKSLDNWELSRGHTCLPIPTRTSDNTGGLTEDQIEVVEPKKHSIIVDGYEYWVDSNKLAILEQLIKL